MSSRTRIKTRDGILIDENLSKPSRQLRSTIPQAFPPDHPVDCGADHRLCDLVRHD